jgi:hypothetical protein
MDLSVIEQAVSIGTRVVALAGAVMALNERRRRARQGDRDRQRDRRSRRDSEL